MNSLKNDLKAFLKNRDNIKKSILVLILFVLLYFIFVVLALPCPILFATGISCPGCGMTRACIHAVRFDFRTAFFYHPLWWTLPVAAIFFILYQSKRISYKVYQRFLKIFAAVFLITYGIRLLFFQSSVIVWKPQNGILPTFFRLFLH